MFSIRKIWKSSLLVATWQLQSFDKSLQVAIGCSMNPSNQKPWPSVNFQCQCKASPVFLSGSSWFKLVQVGSSIKTSASTINLQTSQTSVHVPCTTHLCRTVTDATKSSLAMFCIQAAARLEEGCCSIFRFIDFGHQRGILELLEVGTST